VPVARVQPAKWSQFDASVRRIEVHMPQPPRIIGLDAFGD